MGKFLYERCAVASLDLAYPANKIMFSEIFNGETDVPAVLIRSPAASLTMVKSFTPKKDENDEDFYTLSDLDKFGEIITNKNLGKF
jgi:hypothetical protein